MATFNVPNADDNGSFSDDLNEELNREKLFWKSFEINEPLRIDCDSYLALRSPIAKARKKVDICQLYCMTSLDFERLIQHLEDEDGAFEEYCANLHRLNGIPNPVKRKFSVLAYARRISYSASQIEADMKYFLNLHRQPEKPTMDLEAFLAEEEEVIDWLVEGFIPRGETILLAGIPKKGKTLLAVDAAYAVATGNDFLGAQSNQGKVLLISADESPASTRRKLSQRGFDSSMPLEVMTHFNIQNLEILRDVMESYRPDLVVVDSLKAIARNLSVSENSSEFADMIYDLKELFIRYDAAGLLIHHESKSRENEGINRVRGSGAITGAVWGIWQIQDAHRGREGDGAIEDDRLLKITARDVPAQTLTIHLSMEDFSWQVGGQSPKQVETKTQTDLLLERLHQHAPAGLEPTEIAESFSMPIRQVHALLCRCIDRKLIGKRPSAINSNRSVYYVIEHERSQYNSKYNSSFCEENATIAETYTQKELEPDSKKYNTVTPPKEGDPVVLSQNDVCDHKGDHTLVSQIEAGDWVKYLGRSSLNKLMQKKRYQVRSVQEAQGELWLTLINPDGLDQTVKASEVKEVL